MLQSEKDVEREGRADLRVNLLSRITSFKVSNSNIRSQVVNFICADMKQRFDLAIQLLYQEFVNSMAAYSKVRSIFYANVYPQNVDQELTENDTYCNFLHDLLQSARITLQQNDVILCRLLVEAPRLTQTVFSNLRDAISSMERYAIQFYFTWCLFQSCCWFVNIARHFGEA